MKPRSGGKRVERLSEDLQNQIAAGEVVERPASVVKELVENAVDAHASRIRVDIDQGGLALIRVRDDGDGMDPQDAELALERHATSKLRAFDDLLHLTSFGFRGEALPSIASVSRLTLITRREGDEHAFQVRVDGGGLKALSPASGAIGTTLEVADLFFNVPARRKFLKTIATESTHVGDVILHAALASHDVAFELTRDGKTARNYGRAASRLERVHDVVTGEKLQRVQTTRGPLEVDAYLAAPERARSGATALHLFVNGRPIKDRALARAVAHAYGSVLEAGRYPLGVVYIELPPHDVDVNVHPQKAEVRFADPRALFDAVSRGLGASLSTAFGRPLAHPTTAASYTPNYAKGFADGPVHLASTDAAAGAYVDHALGIRGRLPDLSPTAAIPLREVIEGGFPRADSPTGAWAKAPGSALADEPSLFRSVKFYGGLHFLGQLKRMFLLCEGKDALYILDQHAADERVAFHRLRKAFGQKSVAMQALLTPVIVNASPTELALFEELGSSFEALGLDVRRSGAAALAIHAVPQIVGKVDPAMLMHDLTGELSRHGARLFSDRVDLVLATMACHGSIRGGDLVSREQAEGLLNVLDDVDFSGHCPHGRPVLHRLAFSDLEHKVGR